MCYKLDVDLVLVFDDTSVSFAEQLNSPLHLLINDFFLLFFFGEREKGESADSRLCWCKQ